IVTDGILGTALKTFGLDVHVFDWLKDNYGINVLGDIAIGIDIENVIGGSNVNTFHFIDGATLQGVIAAGARGSIVLDYSKWVSPAGTTGVTVDSSAGLDLQLIPAQTIFGLTTPPVGFWFGSASGVEGNRFGNFEDIAAAAGADVSIIRDFAVTGTPAVIGSYGDDSITGNDKVWQNQNPNDDIGMLSRSNTIFASGGLDTIDGKGGNDLLSFNKPNSSLSLPDGPVTIDLSQGKYYVGDTRLISLTSTSVDPLTASYDFYTTATSGQFSILIGGQMSALMDYNVDTTALQAALSALTNIANVTVSESDPGGAPVGTETNPWQIRYQALTNVTPPGIYVNDADLRKAGRYAAGDAAGTATSIENVSGTGFNDLLIGNSEANVYVVVDHWGTDVIYDVPNDPDSVDILDISGLSKMPDDIFVDSSNHTITLRVVDANGAVNTLTAYNVEKIKTAKDLKIAGQAYEGLGGDAAKPNTLASALGFLIGDEEENYTKVSSLLTRTSLLTGSGRVDSGTDVSDLTDEELQSILQAAIAMWNAANPDSPVPLEDIAVAIADLPGMALGKAEGRTITLDTNGAGTGWFVDPTPTDNSEYNVGSNGALVAVPGGSAASGYDLLTLALHEIGHVEGLAHSSDPASVMSPTLPTGVRKLLSDTDLDLRGPPVTGFDNAPSDQEILEGGLTDLANWAANFGDKLGSAITGLQIPFVDDALSSIWNGIGAQQITDKISQLIKDKIVAVLNDPSRPTVSTDDLLAIVDDNGDRILHKTLSTNSREFGAILTLASYELPITLSLDSDTFFGLKVPVSVTQSEPIILSAKVQLGFVFGIDSTNTFYVENPT
ncbi:MAG TPA: matrixin family metalloprotease, partial [Terriglobia bacterium]|nr:matrixin family metalloprotease [Terriglobia bacterium]